jgi:hypothetical protein
MEKRVEYGARQVSPELIVQPMTIRNYFPDMVEGKLKALGLKFLKFQKTGEGEKLITYKIRGLPKPVEVFLDFEGSVMTGELYETLYYGGKQVEYPSKSKRKEKSEEELERISNDFTRFLINSKSD